MVRNQRLLADYDQHALDRKGYFRESAAGRGMRSVGGQDGRMAAKMNGSADCPDGGDYPPMYMLEVLI